jgi:SNF2 family DNA or RNA helicase
MYKATQFKWRPKKNAKIIVRRVLQPAIRHRTRDCADIPPLVYTDRECALSKEQTAAFIELKRHMVARLKAGEEVTAINAAARLMKLQQLCCGSVYADDGSVSYLDMRDRLRVLMELIEQSEGKVIVFATFKHVLKRLTEEIVKRGSTARMIDGSVVGTQRDKIVRAFQTAVYPRVLVAQPRTASHGLNLTSASTIIWFGPTTSAEQYVQANARMARPGQTMHMSVVHLGSHPVEWGAYNNVKEQNVTQEAILALYNRVIGSP